MKNIVRYIPNTLTSLRIVGAICLMFIEPVTGPFYIIYTVSGVSDALDGFIARRLGCASETGAKLDSVADLLLYIAMFLRVLPRLWQSLPRFMWFWGGAVIATRIAAYCAAALKYRCFASMHTYLNKLTGFLVFLVPYFLAGRFEMASCVAVCAAGGLGSAEELAIHLTSREYNSGRKSLISVRK